MNVTITNYRGLASASLDISKICLLAGPNEAGKTSASQALAAALTGEPIPISGVKKAQVGMLVRSGTANGSVELTGPDGSSTVTWPSAKVTSEGQAPYASHFAAGIQSIVNLDDKERVKVLTEYLKASPSREDFDKQLSSMGLAANVLDQLWELITKQGWDNAATQIKEKGARLKGQWEQITGDRYGSKKADSWIPEGYEPNLEAQSEDKLRAVVTDARDALEAAIAADAVDDSKRAELEALAALLPGRKIDALAAEKAKADPALQNQLDECNGYIASINKNRDEFNATLAALPTAKQAEGMPCPHCNTILQVKGSKLDIASVLSEDEITSRQAAIDAATSQIASINSGIAKHMEAASRLKAQVAAEDAKRKEKIAEALRLVKASEEAEQELKKPVPAKAEISVDDCRSALSRAELALKAYKSKTEADRTHVAVGHNAELLAKVSPEGIRGDVLVRALKDFNKSLERLCTASGWRPVALESDFSPTYGGTIYLLLSESAKFRVRVILQMGMALIDKSQALIIDAADILDKGGRNGLFKAVKAAALPCLVSMTIDSKELVPNLNKAGIGSSYWINSDAKSELIA